MAKSTADLSKTFSPKTCEDSDSAISSAGFSDGPEPSRFQGTQALLEFGLDLAPALHSPQQVRTSSAQDARAACLCRALDELATSYARTADTLGLPMPATYGRNSGDSSPSVALQSFLVSKLAAQMELSGSPEYELRWKSSATVLGPPICALVASQRRTSANACIGLDGWRTPALRDHHPCQDADEKRARGNRADGQVQLALQVMLAGWQTPKIPSGGAQEERQTEGGGLHKLEDQASLAGWPTTAARDWKDGRSNQHGKNARPLNEVAALSGWPTPSATETEETPEALAARVARGRARGLSYGPNTMQKLGTIARGTTPDGTTAETESTAAFRLNPRFSAWLMGYPLEWTRAGQRAYSRLRRRRKGA